MIFHSDVSLPERISIWIQDLALRVSATIWVHSHGGSPNSWMVDFMEHTIRIPLTWMRTGGTPISGKPPYIHISYICSWIDSHKTYFRKPPYQPISMANECVLGPSRDSRPCFWRRRHAYPGHPKACWRWSLDGSRLWIISYHIISYHMAMS